MAYGQCPGQDGHQEWPDDDGRSLPPWRSAQQGDTQRLGPYGQPGYDERGRQGYDERGQQAGGDGRWQPPEWRYGQQRHEQGNGQRGYAPGQYQPQFQPAPPSQPGQRGFGPPVPQPPYGPPQSPYGPPQPPRGKSWPARHKVLTGVFGFAALITIIAVANSGGSPSSSSGTAVGLTTSASATATSSATATRVPSQHPTRAAAPVQKTPAQKATPQQVRTTPPPSHAAAPPAPAPAPAPARTTAAAVAAPPASAAASSCHPLTNGGKCYKAGETCRDSDHSVSGVAGNGEAITCEDNNGWRWEPS